MTTGERRAPSPRPQRRRGPCRRGPCRRSRSRPPPSPPGHHRPRHRHSPARARGRCRRPRRVFRVPIRRRRRHRRRRHRRPCRVRPRRRPGHTCLALRVGCRRLTIRRLTIRRPGASHRLGASHRRGIARRRPDGEHRGRWRLQPGILERHDERRWCRLGRSLLSGRERSGQPVGESGRHGGIYELCARLGTIGPAHGREHLPGQPQGPGPRPWQGMPGPWQGMPGPWWGRPWPW